MENKPPVRCSENEEVAAYLWLKRQEMVDQNGISENLDLTLSIAYRNLCKSKTPVRTLKELSQIKGVGKWILRLMQGYFPKDVSEKSPTKAAAKKTKGPKRYLPQKNSAAYALLITLYRGIVNGSSFMMKQELIDAAEASGLSRTSILMEKGKGKPGQFGSSGRDWYSGWNCMKNLITKGLVVKSSCPAKYMLTEEGQEAARECLLRSGLIDSSEKLNQTGISQKGVSEGNASHSNFVRAASADQDTSSSSSYLANQMKSNHVQIVLSDKDISTSGQVDSSDSDEEGFTEKGCPGKLSACTYMNKVSVSTSSAPSSFNLQACSSSVSPVNKTSGACVVEETVNILAMPPHRFGEKFDDVYDVILILDDRENFGPRSRNIVDSIRSQFKIHVEVRRLPVGDGVWIVRDRQSNNEYVLDFIVERKKVDDLCCSIRDNRYRDQKLRLQRCGLQKLIYLVEGDPNSLEAAESIKTACFTTEILEGFDVQRTKGLIDTAKRYGYLTQAISQYYSDHFSHGSDVLRSHKVCPTFGDFVKKCQDLEKMTVSDVFALQLMQVPQVTEEVALAVVDLYPTVISLARKYAQLEGDVCAQEEMLKNQNKLISGAASKNIFKLIWGG
ncbi:crossover junction endonuclease MUS81 protein [Dioscorea alata]|uniref:Crossover junction endonuclease MUS81 protein n=1 Tax=Dioscorea alata TaxID=55571 RepID=A0ACB7V207_DIOAL|nr:crossover junction endonuclease MUS81 protein [Dioscorea alata]